jgi:hypothetical protein
MKNGKEEDVWKYLCGLVWTQVGRFLRRLHLDVRLLQEGTVEFLQTRPLLVPAKATKSHAAVLLQVQIVAFLAKYGSHPRVATHLEEDHLCRLLRKISANLDGRFQEIDHLLGEKNELLWVQLDHLLELDNRICPLFNKDDRLLVEHVQLILRGINRHLRGLELHREEDPRIHRKEVLVNLPNPGNFR